MSPESKSSAATLGRLLAAITEDRKGLGRRIDEAHEAVRRLASTPADAGALALAAVALHAWYTGVESIFERVARELDGSMPTGDRWHRELLSQMSADIPGLRGPVISGPLVDELAALLAFRHFFRHAYAVTFEGARLNVELARLLRVAARVDEELDSLGHFLRASMAALSGL